MKRLFLKIHVAIMLTLIFSNIALSDIHVKYFSSENIYLNAGSADSLAVGDRLAIKKADSVMAEIEIVYVAEHSSSCKIVKSNGPVEIGAQATLIEKSQKPPVEKTSAAMQVQHVIKLYPAVATVTKPAFTRISGSISMETYYWNDLGPANLDFTEPSTRINLKAAKLWGSDFSFTIRSTTLHDQRARGFSSLVPQSEWHNRIYELSFAYANETSPFSFTLGRIITNRMSGIGYIDGAITQYNLSKHTIIGVFGGTEPQWQSSAYQTSLQKYGAFTGYSFGSFKGTRYEVTLAMAGEYHASIVSREFAYLQNNLNIGSSWNLFQSGELDLNRGWRKSKTNQNLSLTNLYISARHRINSWLSAGLSYDSRRNYWTYEIRSLADSLFDDKLRQGARANASVRLPGEFLIDAGFGFQKKTSDSQPTYSYSLGMNKAHFIAPRFSINLQGTGFTNPFTNGYSLQARLSRSLRKSDLVSVGYGIYYYIIQNSNLKRNNNSISLSSQIAVLRSVYFYGTYEYDVGDDARGHRIIGELGYRF